MRQAAQQAAEAKDIVSAAFSTAVMLTTCGDCHRAVGTMPSAPLTPRPELGGVVGHMLQHQRAADQILQGLIVPSNTLWRAGAEALVAAPLHPSDLPVDATLRQKMAPVEERIHRLAGAAAQVTDSRARASFYAQILAGCADCHRLGPKVWGPKFD
jgi:cytochrome c553